MNNQCSRELPSRPELRVKGPFRCPAGALRRRALGCRRYHLEQIVVDEGQTVQKDDLIAQLMDRDVRAELQKTKAAIQEAQAKLKLLVAGPRQAEIQQAGGGQRPRRLSCHVTMRAADGHG
ncbi:MAG TPA: biotin/lipoyl-binding protein [Candidatus Limnocylindrales bacterium]|nr:biotin/lipoyl-binding protein [Candidatus Limnocylindrales bacterium]